MARAVDQLNVGIVGAGRIADEHLSFLRADPRIEVVAVCDRDRLLARRAAGGTEAYIFDDLDSMLRYQTLDCIHVLTPPDHHPVAVRKAAEAGVSLIVVEKPAAPDYGSTAQMLSQVSSTGSRLTEDHNYRFNPPVQELMRVVESGVLGELRLIEIRMSMALADTRYDQMARQDPTDSRKTIMREFLPHLAYLCLLLVPGAELGRVEWRKLDHRTHIAPDDLYAEVVGPGTATVGHIIFSSGVAPSTTTISVHGRLGVVRADLQNPHVQISQARDVGTQLSPLVDQSINGIRLVLAGISGIAAKLRGSPIYSGIPVFLDRTYAAFLAGQPLPVTTEHILQTACLTTALTQEIN